MICVFKTQGTTSNWRVCLCISKLCAWNRIWQTTYDQCSASYDDSYFYLFNMNIASLNAFAFYYMYTRRRDVFLCVCVFLTMLARWYGKQMCSWRRMIMMVNISACHAHALHLKRIFFLLLLLLSSELRRGMKLCCILTEVMCCHTLARTHVDVSRRRCNRK